MDNDTLFTIAKILFLILFLLTALAIVVGFIRKGRKFSNTDWPYSNMNSVHYFRLGKYMEKRGWKLSKREIIGWIIVFFLMTVGPIISKILLSP
jgi:hypothetical protein